MTWLVYIAAFLIFLAYWRIPRKPLEGWAFSLVGNLLYVIAFLHFRSAELEIAPVGFTILSAWNIWREATKKSAN